MSAALRIHWFRRAELDLRAIRNQPDPYSPLALQRFANRLVAAVESLVDHPERGRVAGRYAREFVFPPYVVRYRVTADTVQILRIRHGARRPD